MDEEFRITLRVRRSQCEEMYDDFASLGPRLRAFRLRSIALDYYRARATAPAPTSTFDNRLATENTSADDAIIEAFGPALGLPSKS